jgi:hypothetical protein
MNQLDVLHKRITGNKMLRFFALIKKKKGNGNQKNNREKSYRISH